MSGFEDFSGPDFDGLSDREKARKISEWSLSTDHTATAKEPLAKAHSKITISTELSEGGTEALRAGLVAGSLVASIISVVGALWLGFLDALGGSEGEASDVSPLFGFGFLGIPLILPMFKSGWFWPKGAAASHPRAIAIGASMGGIGMMGALSLFVF